MSALHSAVPFALVFESSQIFCLGLLVTHSEVSVFYSGRSRDGEKRLHEQCGNPYNYAPNRYDYRDYALRDRNRPREMGRDTAGGRASVRNRRPCK